MPCDKDFGYMRLTQEQIQELTRKHYGDLWHDTKG